MASPTALLLQPDIIELIGRGAYRELREALRALDAPDTAEMLEVLLEAEGAEQAAIAYRVLPRDEAGLVFSHLGPEQQEALITELGAERAVRVVESMDPDDRAKLLDELPVEVTTRIMRSLSPATRRETQAILGYASESVGRLMTPDYVRIRPEWTAGEALDHIRRYGSDAETVNWVYVVDDQGRLIDDVLLRKLLLVPPETPVGELMDERFLALVATDDREEAVRIMNRHDRSALPVVDGLGLLIGIVTFDDVADVAEIEATEDIHKLGGLETLTQPYLATRLKEMLGKRAPWLAGLFCLQLGTIAVMGLFEEQLGKAVVLAVFIPLIVSAGGNTGTQAASMLVRALALEHVGPGDWLRVLRREILVGLTLGSALGLMGTATVLLADAVGVASTEHAGRVAVVVGSAIVGIVVWGSLAGSLLPLLLQRVGLDPATSSSPLVSTIVDVSGLTIYFTLAIALLSGILL